MSDFITLSSTALDCPDARELAAFYADITSGRMIFENDAWATVDGPAGRIVFQTMPDYTPPAWPDPASSIKMHLDFYVQDLAATEARVLAAGARRFEFQPNSDHCFVFADPVGHPFCLSPGATSPRRPTTGSAGRRPLVIASQIGCVSWRRSPPVRHSSDCWSGSSVGWARRWALRARAAATAAARSMTAVK